MINQWGNQLRSDVLVAGHHCDSDATSKPFLPVVKPTVVICSAVHHGNQPHISAITCILETGLAEDRIYRTDSGDSEDGSCIRKENNQCAVRNPSQEWRHRAGEVLIDPLGDDTITIKVTKGGELFIKQ